MQKRQNDIQLPLRESRKIAMERFGLSSESKDYGLYRILNLACRSLGATAASFSIPVRGGSAILEFAGGDIQEPATASLGCISTYTNREITIISGPAISSWNKECATLRDIELTGYVGVPVFNPDSVIKGVMSIFYAGEFTPPDAEQIQFLSDFGRVIEDSLLMKALSIRDPLTQMFNRRYLEEQANIEWRRALRLQVPISFALIDVDHFKSYNDTAGHQAGDEALISLGNVIMKVCQRAGDSACRYGGEEFAIILPMTDAEAAERLIDKIAQEFSTLAISHPSLDNANITFSCGITTKADAEDLKTTDFKSCLIEADKALYYAKETGRNKTIHYEDTLSMRKAVIG
ncbi:diguanylate cyclase [Zhongshania sp.]|uniref:diguanylate cyclase n=1 Tax=Zhongshania sp. TaxID=1971902 RepID=UPI003568CADA